MFGASLGFRVRHYLKIIPSNHQSLKEKEAIAKARLAQANVGEHWIPHRHFSKLRCRSLYTADSPLNSTQEKKKTNAI